MPGFSVLRCLKGEGGSISLVHRLQEQFNFLTSFPVVDVDHAGIFSSCALITGG